MHAPKEIRRWVNRRRHHDGKPNGRVSWLWDAPPMELKLDRSKKNYRRNKRVDLQG
jgi:hypothetical protein